jgi:hypothetical protein
MEIKRLKEETSSNIMANLEQQIQKKKWNNANLVKEIGRALL